MQKSVSMVVAVGSIVLLALIVGSGVWLSAEAPEYAALPVAVAPEEPPVPGSEPEETPPVTKPELAPVETPRQWLAPDICPPVAKCPTVADALLRESVAPWDGEALDLRITHQGQVLDILLYNDGLAELRSGQTVVVRAAVRAQADRSARVGHRTRPWQPRHPVPPGLAGPAGASPLPLDPEGLQRRRHNE